MKQKREVVDVWTLDRGAFSDGAPRHVTCRQASPPASKWPQSGTQHLTHHILLHISALTVQRAMRCSGCWPFTLNKPADKKPTDKQLPDPEQIGLKLLYAGPDPKIDIVAVHGLNGHHKKSWTASNGVNWLVDLLPADLPNMRVYTWGYDASTGGNADGTPSLQRISEELVSKLWETRESTRVHA